MAGGTVEHIEGGDGTVVLDGNVDDGDEVGTVAGIAHPYTFGIDLVGRGVFTAGGHLLTQFLDGVGGVGILLGSEVGSLWNEVCCLGNEVSSFGHRLQRLFGLGGLLCCLCSSLFGFFFCLRLTSTALGSLLCGSFLLSRLFAGGLDRQVAEQGGSLLRLPAVALAVEVLAFLAFHRIDLAGVLLGDACAFPFGRLTGSSALGSLVDDGIDDIRQLAVGRHLDA